MRAKRGIKKREMVPASNTKALRVLNSELDRCNVRWAVVGSLGLAIRGAPVQPNDIDIMTDREGAYRIERTFSSSLTIPVSLSSSDKVRSHFGSLNIGGVEVEITGDFQLRLEDGSWQDPPDFGQLLRTAWFDERRIPVLSLTWEYEAYSRLGRKDRAESVMALLRARKSEKPGAL